MSNQVYSNSQTLYKPAVEIGYFQQTASQVLAAGVTAPIINLAPTLPNSDFTIAGPDLICNQPGVYNITGTVAVPLTPGVENSLRIWLQTTVAGNTPQLGDYEITASPSVSFPAGNAQVVSTSLTLNLFAGQVINLLATCTVNRDTISLAPPGSSRLTAIYTQRLQ